MDIVHVILTSAVFRSFMIYFLLLLIVTLTTPTQQWTLASFIVSLIRRYPCIRLVGVAFLLL